MPLCVSRVALSLLFVLLCSAPGFAQATRTWVSGGADGDDVNPCSRTAPCKTFAGAISKTAAGGIISVLTPGGFGSLTITKSLTIDGGGTEGSVLSGSGFTGIAVNGSGIDVTIRNVTIYGPSGGTYGIRVINGASVSVENVMISGFAIGVEVNTNAQVTVKDTHIQRSSQFGVYFRQGRGTFDNVRLEGQAFDGLRVGNGGVVTIRNSTIVGSGNLGLSATESSTSKLTVENCLVNANAWGIGSADGASVWVSNTTVSNSTTQGIWFGAGSVLVSFGNNRLTNNPTNGTFTSTLALQ